jgi:peptide-methionine (S)-S-oxide reductase
MWAVARGCTDRNLPPQQAGQRQTLAEQNVSDASKGRSELATFGAGCFWGVEETFRQIPGVISTAVGYSGGSKENPTYEDVCTDRTGHAEVVQVEFDPARVSYEQLLEVFWKSHNPTTLNRQGPDVGTQYRSLIFYHSPQQEAAARASKERLQASGQYKKPVVTQIEPARTFWRAAEYHQQYLAKRGLSSCPIPGGE